MEGQRRRCRVEEKGDGVAEVGVQKSNRGCGPVLMEKRIARMERKSGISDAIRLFSLRSRRRWGCSGLGRKRRHEDG